MTDTANTKPTDPTTPAATPPAEPTPPPATPTKVVIHVAGFPLGVSPKSLQQIVWHLTGGAHAFEADPKKKGGLMCIAELPPGRSCEEVVSLLKKAGGCAVATCEAY